MVDMGGGSIVKSKVGELEIITREGRIRRMRKEVVGCVQSVVGKKKLFVRFKYGQKREIISSLLVYLSPKEEVDMEERISHLPKKEQGRLLTINGDPEFGGPCMFVKGMSLSVFIVCVMLSIYLQICRRTRWRKRDIRTRTRRRISDWMQLGKIIEGMLLRKVTIKIIFMH